MSTQDVLLPDLGEGLTEAVIVRWLVDVGEAVGEDQAFVEVETAKATVELPAPFAGTVTTRHAAEGEEVAVGAPILSVEVAGSDAPARGGEPVAVTDATGDGDASELEHDKLLVGLGPVEARKRRRRGQPPHEFPAAHANGAAIESAARPLATPPVRRLAKDLGVDLAAVAGSGPNGRVTREDVHAAAQVAPAVSAVPSPSSPTAQRIPVTGIRGRIADHLSVAWREIPAASCWVECDATRLLALRAELASAHPDVRLTPLAILLRCCVVALTEHPELNASFDAGTREIVRHSVIHLGVAAQTERGLVVPVVRDADNRSVLDLARTVERLATDARSGTLAPAAMVGSTFSVSNFGAFGVDGGTPIVNHPEAAIVGIGRIAKRPWVVDERIEVRNVVILSVTFDHRVCDGAEAAVFLRRVADLIEQPTLLLAH